MIYTSESIIICFCPECGKICSKDIYFFNFHALKGKTIICEECKSVVAEIVVENTKKYKIRILCSECGNIHEIIQNSFVFWKPEVFIRKCKNTNIIFLIIGEKESSKKLAKKIKESKEQGSLSIEDLLEESGENHSVFAEIVNVVRDLNKKEKIVCECSNKDILLTLNKRSIKFFCEKCKNIKILRATKKELIKIKKNGLICVEKI